MTPTQIFLIDNLLGGLVQLIMDKQNLDIPKAMEVLYSSKLYDKIMDVETGLYFQSSDYNYEILEEDLLDKSI